MTAEGDDRDSHGKGFVPRDFFDTFAAHAWISCDVTDIKDAPVNVKEQAKKEKTRKEDESEESGHDRNVRRDDETRARMRVGQLEYTIRMDLSGGNVPSTKSRHQFFEGLLIPPNTEPTSKVRI